ncbi:MAG: DUF488 domain-containing protein [Clostridium sp.]|nr:DUF488 domain-containing protein [Clostridium sp.]
MKKIYTIGHSSHTSEYFLYLLRKFGINSIVDIRSIPFSRYVPHFNKDNIKNFLNSNHIYYIYMAREFGLLQEGENLLHPEGYLDFNKVRQTSSFNKGVERLKNGLHKDYRIAIMCAEKDPIDCHRSILVAPALIREGYSVVHILPDGKRESHEEFEERLLQLYFPKTPQQNFFDIIEEDNSRKTLINMAYALRNRDLIYKTKITK